MAKINFRAMRRLLGLSVLMIGSLSSSGASAAEVWLKAETPDAAIFSDVSKGDLEDFAIRYAEFRVGFNALLSPDGRRAPPSTILLFRKASTLRAYASSENHKADENLTSWTTNIDSGSLMALALAGDVDQALTMTFEFDTGWALGRVGYILPLWMRQGTGEVLASTHVRRGKVIIGDDEDRLTVPLDRNSWLKWDKFFGMNESSPEYTGKKDGFTGVYQAQAWVLMHDVLLEDGDGRGRFQQLAKLVYGTRTDAATVATFLGTTPNKLGDVLHSHLFRSRTREFPIDLPKLKAGIHIGPAPQAELRVALGDLLNSAGARAEAQAQYDQARALSPHSALVREALARLELMQGDRAGAAADYREAIEAGSHDSKAYLLSAEDRLNDASNGGMDRAGAGGEVAVLALGEIHHALELSPGDGEIYNALGRALFLADPITIAQVEELTPALADPVYGRFIRRYRALLYDRLGMTDAAVGDYNFILADPNTPQGLHDSVAQMLQGKAFEADHKKVTALVEQKHYDEAHAITAAGQQRGDEATMRDYVGLDAWISDNQIKDQMNELIGEKKWVELRDLAIKYRKEHPHGGLINAARQARQMAAQALHEKSAGADEDSGPTLIVVHQLQVHTFFGNRHWTDFKNYLDHLEDKITAQWKETYQNTPEPKFAGKISVAFTLSASGDVVRIDRIKAEEGTPEAVKTACSAAIQQAAPFEHWGEDMTEVLGQEQHLLISFTN